MNRCVPNSSQSSSLQTYGNFRCSLSPTRNMCSLPFTNQSIFFCSPTNVYSVTDSWVYVAVYSTQLVRW